MKRLVKTISTFLLDQPVWLFLTGVLFIDYILMVEAETYTWPFYLVNFGVLTLVFFPVFLFVSLRPWLTGKLHRYWMLGLWGLVFVVYPLLIHLFPIDLSFIPHAVFTEESGLVRLKQLSLLISGFFLALEIYLQTQSFWQWDQKRSVWGIGPHLERYILILIGVIAFLVSGIEVLSAAQEVSLLKPLSWLSLVPEWLLVGVQYFLIGLVYYLFYYLNHYLLIPVLLKRRGLVYYAFGVMACILIFYPLLFQIVSWLPIAQEDLFTEQAGKQIFPEDRGGAPFLVMLLSVPVIILLEWYRQANDLALLEKEKVSTELSLLKQQINPHFFFNTLNNLYALSLKKDENTPEVILQLADLMRYVIYRGQQVAVTIEEEIQYLEDYLRLQSLRVHKNLDLQFDKDIADPTLQIPPLLFIILVENAYKHGVEPAENDCQLYIRLETNQDELRFICTNSVEEGNGRPPGIGLQNLRRRLTLLFPEQHVLKTEQINNQFRATLSINL